MFFLAPLVAAPILAPSQVLTVDDNGGADFIEIADAVLAAQYGETILVASGSYKGFVVDKSGLTIAADSGAVVDILGSVYVFGVESSTTVQLSGLRVQGADGQPALTIGSCSGSVFVDDCLFIGPPAPDFPDDWSGAAVVVESALQVAVSDSTLFGTDSGKAVNTEPGGSGLVVSGSQVHLSGVQLLGGDGANATSTTSAASGGPGLSATTSKVTLQGSAVTGGKGGAGQPLAPSCAGGDGGVAAALVFAELVHRGSELFPGQGGSGATTETTTCLAGDDAETFSSIGGTVVQLPGASRAIDAWPSPARAGELVNLSFEGQAGDLVVLAYSYASDFAAVPGLAGMLMVGPPIKTVPLGSIPLDGGIDISIPAPEVTEGATNLFFQLIAVSGNGYAVLGENDLVVILDPDL